MKFFKYMVMLPFIAVNIMASDALNSDFAPDLFSSIQYRIYHPDTNRYVFVSSDDYNGDNLVEAHEVKYKDENRNNYNLIPAYNGVKLYNPTYNSYAFVSNDRITGDKVVEAHGAKYEDEDRNSFIFRKISTGIFKIYHPNTNSYIFVSNDLYTGDNVVEAHKVADESRNSFRMEPVADLQTELFNFEFDTEQLNQALLNSQPSYIGKSVIEVKSDNVGSTITQTFSKSSTDQYSWSLTEKIGITTKGKVGLPLVAEGEVSVTLDFSSTQTWTSSNTITVGGSVAITPKSVGIYELSYIINYVEDIDIPFTAHAKVSGVNSNLSALAVRSVYDYKNYNSEILEVNPSNNYLIARITGSVKASFGFSQRAIVKQISDTLS